MKLDLMPFAVSLHLGLWVTAILAVTMFPCAWLFARSRGRWVPWVESLFSLSLVLPPTVLGFYLLIFLSPFSPLGHFLESSFGLRLVFTFPGLVVASCVAGTPFMISALRNGILAIPEHLLEASWTLGKGRLATIWLVVLPNMRPAIAAALVTTFAHTLGEFGVVLMIGGSLPGITKVVSIAIFERTEAQDFGSAHLYAAILLVLSYAGVFLLNRLQRQERRRDIAGARP
jgi:molybdate transport system permease protein